MECPSCSHANIEGADGCACCGADLTFLGRAGGSGDIEADLLTRPLGELLAQDYVLVPPDRTVRETIRQWHEEGHHCAIVAEGGAIVGIFTERDVLAKIAGAFEKHADEPVSRYMTADVETLNDKAPVAYALNRMMNRGYRHVPVQRDGSLVGVVSVRDVLKYLAEHFVNDVSTPPAT